MKKITLFLIIILVFLTGCGKKSEKKESLNGLLEYKLTKNWQDMSNNVSTIAEVAVQKIDNSIGLMAEYTKYSKDNPEGFMQFQENAFQQTGGVFEEEFSLDEKGRKIYGKIFKASEEDSENKFVAGIMEIEKNKDAYISFVATLISAEDAINEMKDFLNTINFTRKTLDEKKHIIPKKEYFEFDLPQQYRRSSRSNETNFIKALDDGVLYASLTTLTKENLKPEEQFENLNKEFNSIFAESEVYKEESLEKLDDTEIRSKIYKYSLNGSNAYSYFNVIDFTKSNLMVVCVYDILTNSDFEPIEQELKALTESVKLKKNAEKILEKDIKALKKEIEKNQKQMEKEKETITEEAEETIEKTTEEMQTNSEKE